MAKKRAYTDTTVPPMPGNELDIMKALLMTPPPPATLGKPKTRKRKKRKAR